LSVFGIIYRFDDDTFTQQLKDYCKHETPCKFGEYNVVVQFFRLALGIGCVCGPLHALFTSDEESLSAAYHAQEEEEEGAAYGSVALDVSSQQNNLSSPYAAEQERAKKNKIASVPLPPTLLDRNEHALQDDIKAWKFGLNTCTLKAAMAAYVLFDMTMAIVSLSLLMSVNFTQYNTTEDCNAVLSISIPSCSPDWGCRSCKMMFFHAMSWFVLGPYLLLYLWIWLVDLFLGTDANKGTHDKAAFTAGDKGVLPMTKKKKKLKEFQFADSNEENPVATKTDEDIGEPKASEGYHSEV